MGDEGPEGLVLRYLDDGQVRLPQVLDRHGERRECIDRRLELLPA